VMLCYAVPCVIGMQWDACAGLRAAEVYSCIRTPHRNSVCISSLGTYVLAVLLRAALTCAMSHAVPTGLRATTQLPP
jgi:hypothetical protein